MISKDLCDKVIVIGPRYKHPKGGIAQILYNYDNYVFERMIGIEASGSKFFTNLKYLINSCSKLLWLLLTDKNIKVVHIHTASGRSFQRSVIYFLIAKLMRVQIIMHIHSGSFKNYYDNANKKFIGRVLSSCDAVIALTDKWKQTFENDLQLSNIHVVHNVIPKPKIQKITSDEKIHFLFMGLIVKAKGIFDLVQAVSLLPDNIKQQIVLHIGGRGEVDILQNMISDLNLTDIVKYEGWIDKDRKIEFLNMCQVLAQPSYVEALSLSILEGMSYKMSILATNIGGIPTIVKDGLNGILVKPGDVESLARAIVTIVTDDSKRHSMEQASVQIIEKYYPDNVAKELTNLYLSLVKTNKN